MKGRFGGIESCRQLQAGFRGATKIPRKFAEILTLLQISELMLLSVMPEHRLAKHQPKGHVVNQSLERARRCAGPEKIRVRPPPEAAMPISAIVPLYSEPQRLALKTPAVEGYAAGKRCIGMRRARKPNPAFIAQGDAKGGVILQVPGNLAAVNFQRSPAGVFLDSTAVHPKIKWTLLSGADMQVVQRKPSNEALRLALKRKIRSPHLYRHALRISRATEPPWIHQQIAKPPGAAAVHQPDTNKPHFVATAGGERGIDFVQSPHGATALIV